MGTVNAAIYVITGALNADQAALNIVSNNVANASNTAYAREVPNWAENQPVTINGISYGNGASVTGGISQRDRVLEQRLQQQQQLGASSTALLTALTTLQASFPTASSGTSTGNIGSDLTGLFNAYSQLEASPLSNPLRQQVLSAARQLAGDISGTANSLNTQQASLDQSVNTIVSQVNTISQSLAQVNRQIQSLSPNQDAGVLEDQRQADLSQLSSLIGFNQISTEQNGLSVTTASGQLLVSEGTSIAITTGSVNGVTHLFAGATDITDALASGGGQIGGLLTARDQNIPSTLASLDQLAYGIATQINTINNGGADLAGDNGGAGNIFNAPAQIAGSAQSMSVVMTDPNKIAAASLGQGTGDNANAVSAAALANQLIINGQTPSNFYSNLISTLGASVSGTTIQGTALTASITQLQTQRDALSAVNLNDEASSLQEFQRSYQAASQVFSILNTIVAAAINMGVETAVS
jgi:flagellar hook-associated protein 1 FlgK